MVNLESYGVQELNIKEKEETNGGDFGLGLAITGIILGAISISIYVVDNWDKAKQGYADGVAAANKN